MAWIACLNSMHRRTLEIILTDLVTGTMGWAGIEALLIAAGTQVAEALAAELAAELAGKSLHQWAEDVAERAAG
jgi:hypothetical protein